VQAALRDAERLALLGRVTGGALRDVQTHSQLVADTLRFMQEGLGRLRALGEAAQRWPSPESCNGEAAATLAAFHEAMQAVESEGFTAEIPVAVARAIESADRAALCPNRFERACSVLPRTRSAPMRAASRRRRTSWCRDTAGRLRSCRARQRVRPSSRARR
jgi:hypothetical protein